MKRFLLLTMVGVLYSPLALAQTGQQQSKPLQDFNSQQNEVDLLRGGGVGGNGFNMFDWIHRSNLGGKIGAEDFNEQQGENLDSAAAAFRRQQQQMLRQSDQNNNGSSVVEKK